MLWSMVLYSKSGVSLSTSISLVSCGGVALTNYYPAYRIEILRNQLLQAANF